ncbi:MAG: transporter substrate-binding domain-containing protein [Lachnospiraceae bacterium]|nr:transporter substrate-binding domain-containing protein [Lachnospiraceae bacterium]
MKKFFAVALAAAMTASLAACGSSTTETTIAAAETEAAESTEETEGVEAVQTVTPGKLTVATSPDFAPYEFYAIDENGEPHLAGFDMSLAQYIADYMGLELEVIPMDFDGTIMELSQGNVDLGMAGYSPSPDREDIMDFSDIYISGGQSFVCLKDNADKFASLEDTNKAEYTIGAQTGSIQADLAKRNSPDADIIEMAKVTDIIAELLAGKMDGAYIETMVAESYAKNYPELDIVLDVPYEAVGSVIGVNKGNAALLETVNAAIKECKDSGEFDNYVFEANELASGDIVEGLIEDDAAAAETEAADAETAETEAEETKAE